MTRLIACAVAAFVAAGSLAGPVGAATANRYTSFWAFGDSLTDPGNLFDLTLGLFPPSPPYAERRSNGPVWAEHIAESFARRGLANDNFAYGFGNAVTNDDGLLGLPVQVPDLPEQIDDFALGSAGRLGDRPVGALWFGANDLFAAFRTGDPGVVSATAQAAAGAIAAGIGDLADLGLRDFVVMSLPPLELVPAFNLNPDPNAKLLAQLGAQTFNDALGAALDGLGGSGLNITPIDIDAAFRALIADPGSIGLSDVTFPCYVPPDPEIPPFPDRCSDAELATKMFFDPVHPTATVHEAIADLVRPSLAPIPLPAPAALLVAGLAGLAAVGRRRAA